jgi:hypothetical protein
MTSLRLKQAQGELAELLTGITRNRVLVGPDGLLKGPYPWSILCKRGTSASLAKVACEWWPEAVLQARGNPVAPVLFYRTDTRPWRVLWPAGVHLGQTLNGLDLAFGSCLESDPETWWRMVRRLSIN